VPIYVERNDGAFLLATPGRATCTGATRVNGRRTGRVTCQVRGAGVIQSMGAQDYETFQVPAGRTATMVVNGDDSERWNTCFLNAPG
jgi:hypothetical protein